MSICVTDRLQLMCVRLQHRDTHSSHQQGVPPRSCHLQRSKQCHSQLQRVKLCCRQLQRPCRLSSRSHPLAR